jgi:hypothetical protein
LENILENEKSMDDESKICYLIKKIDYLMDSNSTDEMHDRMDNIVYDPEFKSILDGCKHKPKFLLNF